MIVIHTMLYMYIVLILIIVLYTSAEFWAFIAADANVMLIKIS